MSTALIQFGSDFIGLVLSDFAFVFWRPNANGSWRSADAFDWRTFADKAGLCV